MSFIDVGQGDSVLVQAGGEGYLIDAGRAEEGPNIVDFLRDRGVRDLDGIVVSNPDADHIGGFIDVFDAFPVHTVYLSGDPKGTLPTTPSCAPPATRARTRRSCAPGCSWTGAASGPTRASQNTQPPELRFRAMLGQEPKVELALV